MVFARPTHQVWPPCLVAFDNPHVVDSKVEKLVDGLERARYCDVVLELDCYDLIGERLERAEDELPRPWRVVHLSKGGCWARSRTALTIVSLL